MDRPARENSCLEKLKADLRVWETAWKKKAGVGMILRLLLLEGGFQFVLLLRVVEFSARIPVVGSLLSIIFSYWTNRFFACDIARRVSLGGGLFIPHPTGIVIGADVVIGQQVSIMHQVTIGRVRPGNHSSPRVEDNVYIAPGTKILGEVTIGAGCTVGANSVVLKTLPAGCVAVGSPARVVKQKHIGDVLSPPANA